MHASCAESPRLAIAERDGLKTRVRGGGYRAVAAPAVVGDVEAWVAGVRGVAELPDVGAFWQRQSERQQQHSFASCLPMTPAVGARGRPVELNGVGRGRITAVGALHEAHAECRRRAGD